MQHDYEPLHLRPGDGGLTRSYEDLFCLGSSDNAEFLTAQLEARASIPPEVWGDNPDRSFLATAIGQIIANEILWPNANFVPEDPFRLLVFPPARAEDLEIPCILIGIEQMVGYEVTDELMKELCNKTFGEVVDVLLEGTPSEVEAGERLPVVGAAAPERRACPSLAMFLDIRARLALSNSGLPRMALRPSIPIGEVLNRRRMKRFDRYLVRRFGVSVLLQGSTAWRDALALGLTGTLVSVLGTLLFMAGLCALDPVPEGAVIRAVVASLLIGGIGLSLTLCAAVPAYVVARVTHWLRRDRGSRIVTFADLVRWIQYQRTGWLETCEHTDE